MKLNEDCRLVSHVLQLEFSVADLRVDAVQFLQHEIVKYASTHTEDFIEIGITISETYEDLDYDFAHFADTIRSIFAGLRYLKIYNLEYWNDESAYMQIRLEPEIKMTEL